ncbi:MAG TPA: hypothetical protein VI455_01995 [Terriglobia bacterium]
MLHGQSAVPAGVPAGTPAQIPSELQNPFTTVTTLADSERKVGDVLYLVGRVDVSYHEAQVTADQATYNQFAHTVEASGNVSFSDPMAHLEADHASYNLSSGAGSFTNVRGYLHPRERPGPNPRLAVVSGTFYVSARQIDRLDENTYLVRDGRLTSCENECTGWSLAVRSARLTVGDKAVSYGDVFRFLGVPVLYAPAMEHSLARSPRQTGFLIPTIGSSSQKGTIIGDGFYWAINPSADLMMGVDDYSLRGVATIGRFRSTPSDTSQLAVNYYGVNDHGGGAQSAPGESIRAVGDSQDLGAGFRGVINMDYVNSLAFRNTWSGNFNEAVSSEARQIAFATKNFDSYSLNLFGERYEDFLCAEQSTETSNGVSLCNTPEALADHIIIRHLPSVSFAGEDQQLGSSLFYVDFDASADGLGREEPGFKTPFLTERVDFHPEITLRAPEFGGFHFTPVFGVEATSYGTSVIAPHEGITRLLGDFSLDIRPPSFERVFNKRIHHYRLKHMIEPDIRYNLVRPTNPQQISDIVRFDGTDIWAETSEFEYSLKTTLYGRPDAPDDDPNPPQARELVSLSLTQKYYFDPTFGGVLRGNENQWEPTIDLTGFAFAQGRRLSPLVTVLKIAPFSNFDTEVRADFSPSGGGVLNAGITSAVHHGEFSFEATEFFVDRTQTVGFGTVIVPVFATSQILSSNLFNARIIYGRPDHKGFSGAFGVNYNISESEANAVVAQVTYNFNCFGIDFGYNRFNLGPLRDENQFRIAISLSNVGSFGNLKTRDRLWSTATVQ